MTTTISGTTGVSQVQDGSITTADIGDAQVTPAKTQLTALPSCVRLSGAPSPQFGTTNTMIRRFLTTHLNQGADITYADTSAAGASFTINTSGVYAISYSDNGSSALWLGVSLNSSQLTVGINSINAADTLTIVTTSAGGYVANCGWVGYLPSGSVIRPHTTGVNASTQNISFCIQRVA